ncbi:hypothetical protein [uncultured Microbacterium sp.]|uniref:hypothetical protein n=1 Tax=uncultured Microbacterium sp. TaxID=191216 RepID=UPI0028E55F12|nr:hypothetical protein [uncultured Microbacterium sp.]
MTDYTPTTSEVREAYAKRRALYLASSGHVLANDAKYNRDDYAEFDRWLAARDAEVRKNGEPSDAQTEAACGAFYNDPSDLTQWSRLVEFEGRIADKYRARMRAALRAAGGAR